MEEVRVCGQDHQEKDTYFQGKKLFLARSSWKDERMSRKGVRASKKMPNSKEE